MGAPMTKIAIVVGNPMRDSYSEALGQVYLRGAESGGHEAKLFLLARMNFDAILREGCRREQPLEPDLLTIQGSHNRASWSILKGKSARIIMTMGMPGWFYRWYFGAHALKLFKRNILHFTGVSPVRSTVYGMVEGVGDDKRKQWLREVEALGHQAR